MPCDCFVRVADAACLGQPGRITLHQRLADLAAGKRRAVGFPKRLQHQPLTIARLEIAVARPAHLGAYRAQVVIGGE